MDNKSTPMTSVAPSPGVLKSTLLAASGFSHAFFTREGGVSPLPFGPLNFSSLDGDTEEAVEQNLKLAAGALGLTGPIYFQTQVHGAHCRQVSPGERPEDLRGLQGDALIAQNGDLAIAVRTADCVPILLACRKTGMVGACHAGWRGCVLQVVPNAAAQMRDSGATDLIAAIGPHISADAFEVSPEVAAEILEASPDKDIVDQSRERPHIDLRKMVRAQLLSVGLTNEAIDDVFGCTYLEPARFHSFRRDARQSGRLLSAIRPRA